MKVILSLVLASALMGCSTADTATSGISTAGQTGEETITSASTEPFLTATPAPSTADSGPGGLPGEFSDGIYRVGEEIPAGLYRLEPEYFGMGYVARLSSIKEGEERIIANETFHESAYVEIRPDDVGVELSRVTLRQIDVESLPRQFASQLSDGTYLVGVEIEPGRYRVDPDDDFGYVARLKHVAMDPDGVIADDIYNAPGYITIAPSDFAVKISSAVLTKEK